MSDYPMKTPLNPSERELTNYYSEPFTGWRAWDIILKNDKAYLQSITHHDLWLPGEEIKAKCKKISNKTFHSAPHLGCDCGIHSVKIPEDALKWKDFGQHVFLRAYGEVYLWGIVHHYTDGYTAQYAYPKKIWVEHFVETAHMPKVKISDGREAVKELRRNYRGLEVRLM